MGQTFTGFGEAKRLQMLKGFDKSQKPEKKVEKKEKKKEGDYPFLKDGKYSYDYDKMTPSEHEQAMKHHKDEWYKMHSGKDESENKERHKREHQLHKILSEKKNESFEEMEKGDDYDVNSTNDDMEMSQDTTPEKERSKRKVKRVMKEFKRGTLKSGGKKPVTDQKQALAIALSEAGLSKSEAIELFSPDEDVIEKAKSGEGSHGGKIIGHTKSGKPIYQAHHATHKEYKEFKAADHIDAAMAHQKEGDKFKLKREDTPDLAKEKMKQFGHHERMVHSHYLKGIKMLPKEELDTDVENHIIEKPTHRLSDIPITHDEYHTEDYEGLRKFVDKHGIHEDFSDPDKQVMHFHGTKEKLTTMSRLLGGSEEDVKELKSNGGKTKKQKE